MALPPPPIGSKAQRTPSRSVCMRLISCILGFALTTGDPAWAAEISAVFHASFSSRLADLSVPIRFGQLTDRWMAPQTTSAPKPMVILIQDLHANVGVQKNNVRRLLSGFIASTVSIMFTVKRPLVHAILSLFRSDGSETNPKPFNRSAPRQGPAVRELS